ncbi:3-oxoacyl-[acyl-carrier-protein] reductase FabG [Rubripirellula amarantea]|uniref:3-oxoacyl-[acyl-carrier-protein] reductase FabG n=1 Tax=Rubripirellula amarantea TaxID=2527999 RepID=A0A5C5WTV0_9BACT|nr:SDR family oxidoreductase [Rubripirellula amarantea]TWT54354.1 3-oxoacyl-[acyl-carrier-protein] reductase FabG [Rubripirellula amarantea]
MNETYAKVAIVTGASRGIGASIAMRLATDGFAVVINYSSEAAPAEALVASIRDVGGKADCFRADVSDPVAVSALFNFAESSFGGLGVLVNNAGMLTTSTIAEFDDDAFDRLVAVNLKGCFNAMRESAKRMCDGGRIINLSSSVIGLNQPQYGVYVATKAGVEAMGRVLAKELRGRNICVNAVAPGPTETELFLEGKSDDLVDSFAKLSPLERLGQPDDIASVVSFLAGSDGGWVNGQVLRANGGIV